MTKRKTIILVAIVAVLICGCLSYAMLSSQKIPQDKIDYAYNYCKRNNKNTRIILFCDFGIHSGKYRFSVYDVRKKKVILSSLCAQGKGGGSNESTAFSNRHGSYCSSLGFYQVGYYHKMRIGVGSFILKGLSPTNSNATGRGILIHPYHTVSDIPVYPFKTSRRASKGCFVLSPYKFSRLKRILRKYDKVILYAYK